MCCLAGTISSSWQSSFDAAPRDEQYETQKLLLFQAYIEAEQTKGFKGSFLDFLELLPEGVEGAADVAAVG